MDYNARFYDPMLGRFTSPDSIVPDPGSVIGYNRFAYVNNNPMIYTDPSGHCIAADGDINMSEYPFGSSGLCSGDKSTGCDSDNTNPSEDNTANTDNSDTDRGIYVGTIYDNAFKDGSDTFVLNIPQITPEQLESIQNYWMLYEGRMVVVDGFVVTGLAEISAYFPLVVDVGSAFAEDKEFERIYKQFEEAAGNEEGLQVTFYKNSFGEFELDGGGIIPESTNRWTPWARRYAQEMIDILLLDNDMYLIFE